MPSLSEETDGAVTMLEPGSTIGIVGGGQLGRMMALSARYHGFKVGVLDPTPDCPTAQVADFQITAAYDSKDAIRELAERSNVITYEFENVDADALDEVRDIVAVPQGTDLLR
ncbi:NAD(P)-binding domain-containing protein, partial [Bifidobacterium crudilactis]